MLIIRLREWIFIRRCRRVRRALVMERARIEAEMLAAFNANGTVRA